MTRSSLNLNLKKNKTIILLAIGVSMIVSGFALNVVYWILDKQNSVDVGYCVLSKVDSSNPINDTNTQGKLAKLLELAEQNPASYEQIAQPCLSEYPAYLFHLGWISGIIFIAGIVIVIVSAMMMIKNRRKQQRQEEQREKEEGGINI
jgi:hypothetical protein